MESWTFFSSDFPGNSWFGGCENYGSRPSHGSVGVKTMGLD